MLKLQSLNGVIWSGIMSIRWHNVGGEIILPSLNITAITNENGTWSTLKSKIVY